MKSDQCYLKGDTIKRTSSDEYRGVCSVTAADFYTSLTDKPVDLGVVTSCGLQRDARSEQVHYLTRVSEKSLKSTKTKATYIPEEYWGWRMVVRTASATQRKGGAKILNPGAGD